MGTQKHNFDVPLVSIVDDDASVRRSTRRLLRSTGLRAEAFGSAEEFLASGLAADPACLLLDLRMPGMNGLQLQAHLAGVANKVPIIFLSALSLYEEERMALAAGAAGFLKKPVSADVLLLAIRGALSSPSNNERTLP